MNQCFSIQQQGIGITEYSNVIPSPISVVSLCLISKRDIRLEKISFCDATPFTVVTIQEPLQVGRYVSNGVTFGWYCIRINKRRIVTDASFTIIIQRHKSCDGDGP